MTSFNLLGWPFKMGIYRCGGHSSACNRGSGRGVKGCVHAPEAVVETCWPGVAVTAGWAGVPGALQRCGLGLGR